MEAATWLKHRMFSNMTFDKLIPSEAFYLRFSEIEDCSVIENVLNCGNF